jgi:hypothetical protein
MAFVVRTCRLALCVAGAGLLDAELNKDGWRISCPTCPSGVGGGVPVVDGDLKVQSVTARLNYRFGG